MRAPDAARASGARAKIQVRTPPGNVAAGVHQATSPACAQTTTEAEPWRSGREAVSWWQVMAENAVWRAEKAGDQGRKTADREVWPHKVISSYLPVANHYGLWVAKFEGTTYGLRGKTRQLVSGKENMISAHQSGPWALPRRGWPFSSGEGPPTATFQGHFDGFLTAAKTHCEARRWCCGERPDAHASRYGR